MGPSGCSFCRISSPAVTFTRVAEEDPPCGSLWKAYQLPLKVSLQFLEFYEMQWEFDGGRILKIQQRQLYFPPDFLVLLEIVLLCGLLSIHSFIHLSVHSFIRWGLVEGLFGIRSWDTIVDNRSSLSLGSSESRLGSGYINQLSVEIVLNRGVNQTPWEHSGAGNWEHSGKSDCVSHGVVCKLENYSQGSSGDAGKKKRLVDTVHEGEGGMSWENSMETYTLPYVT